MRIFSLESENIRIQVPGTNIKLQPAMQVDLTLRIKRQLRISQLQ